MQYKFYAGIGSRDTPIEVCNLMTEMAEELADHGFTLRSGHAEGADIAFEKGSKGKNQIWLPWKGFNNAGKDGFSQTTHYIMQPNELAVSIAEKFHPNWAACTDAARKLHTRNVYQVLGPGLGYQADTVSLFVICWTKDGKASGGTGQAIRIAEHCNIPVFNLQHADGLDKLVAFLQEMK